MITKENYHTLAAQITALIEGETSRVANLANIAAALKEVKGWFWVGFYLVDGAELVLGPFQGPVACTRIAKGRGVCGTSWSEARSILVPDVHAFPGHIACSAHSRSEVVIPVIVEGQVVMVLDVDSDKLDDFDEQDLATLEEIGHIIAQRFTSWS